MILSITLDRKKGGIANSLISYSKALDLIGEKHLIILPNDAAAKDELLNLPNVQIFPLKKSLLYFHLLTRFIFKRDYKHHIEDSKWIFIHNSKLINFFNQYSFKLGMINHSGKLRNTLHRAFNIFLTHAGYERFISHYPDNESTNLVIPHGFEQLSKVFSLKKNKVLKVISAGRFVTKKGFNDLIKAAEKLQRDKFPVQIELFGSGPQEVELRKKINDQALKNIRLIGWTEDLHNEFRKADVFCITSLEEPFGLIIGEAMMSGLPVISTQTDGAMEIFGTEPEKKGAIYVDFSSPDEIKNAIQALSNDEKRLLLAQNAHDNINTNFSLERLSRKLKDLFEYAD